MKVFPGCLAQLTYARSAVGSAADSTFRKQAGGQLQIPAEKLRCLQITNKEQNAQAGVWPDRGCGHLNRDLYRPEPSCSTIRSRIMFKRPHYVRSFSNGPHGAGRAPTGSPQHDRFQPPCSVQLTEACRSPTHPDHDMRFSGSQSTLVISTELKSGQRFRFEVVPEVAYHVLEEVREGAQHVHFEDICEKPVTLSCRHLKWIKVDPLTKM